MATIALKPPSTAYSGATANNSTSKLRNKFACVSFSNQRLLKHFTGFGCSNNSRSNSDMVKKFVLSASDGETVAIPTDAEDEDAVQESESELEGNTDWALTVDSATESGDTIAEESVSVVISSLNSYNEAFADNDEAKLAEIEAFLQSLEEEKTELEMKVATLSEELSYAKDRVLRIGADFDNFRKRTERFRLSTVSNAKGEVLENLLPVLDNFERAKAQINVKTELEEKINNSYQNIYKQFLEIMGSLGVVQVETVGKAFDPTLHEGIVREESTEFEDGVILEEYRKGFKLGERLLRPSMVKVSAGPGPAKHKTGYAYEEEEDVNENGNGSYS